MNTRHFTRVKLRIGASIKYGNEEIFCNTDNLSLRGMYIHTERDIPLNVPVNVTVFNASQTAFKFNAKVVRREGSGIGLQIHNLNVNSFVQLRKIVTENSSDQGAVMQETYKMLKCIY
jgi:hypothetical protein